MIQLDIVTPAKKIVEAIGVTDVRLPAAKGEIGILPGHAELLTILTAGVLAFKQDGQERKFALSHGFAQLRHDKIIVLAETCEESTDIDIARAKVAQKKAEETLTGSLTEENFRKHQLKLQRAVIRQQVGRS